MIEQSDSDSETSDHAPPEGGNGAAQPYEDDESIIPINSPEGAPPSIPFVTLNYASLTSDNASVANSDNPDEPDPEHLQQASKSGHPIWSSTLNQLSLLYL